MDPRTPLRIARPAALLAVLLVTAAAGGEPAPLAEEGPIEQAAVDRATLTVAPAAPRTLHEQLAAVLADRDRRLVELRAAFTAAVDETEALTIQRSIDRVQREAEISLLRTQLEFAHERADAEAVTGLEAALETMGAAIDDTVPDRDAAGEDER